MNPLKPIALTEEPSIAEKEKAYRLTPLFGFMPEIHGNLNDNVNFAELLGDAQINRFTEGRGFIPDLVAFDNLQLSDLHRFEIKGQAFSDTGEIGVFIYPKNLYLPIASTDLSLEFEKMQEINAQVYNWTSVSHIPFGLVQNIKKIFDFARDEVFEDGYESSFSHALVFQIVQHGRYTINVIRELILNERVNFEIASEALKWIGLVEDPPTLKARVRLLEDTLFSKSPKVRDGALLGISFLNDSSLAEILRQAIEVETVSELRKEMEEVLRYFEG